jgi:hypothetical protein
VVNGDNKREADETFYLDLFGNSNSWFTKTTLGAWAVVRRPCPLETSADVVAAGTARLVDRLPSSLGHRLRRLGLLNG